MPDAKPNIGRIDESALGMLYLTLHDDNRAWKGFGWDVLDRLYKAGLIGDPKGKVKSVTFTSAGLVAAEAAFHKLFTDRA